MARFSRKRPADPPPPAPVPEPVPEPEVVVPPPDPELYVPAGHFYSPVVDPVEAAGDAALLWRPDMNDLPGIDVNIAAQVALLDELDRYAREVPWGSDARDGLRFFFANEWFPPTNAMCAYLLLRHLRPKRYIEVGSGFSSALALDVNDRFLDGRMELTFIEPNTERLEELLADGDRSRVRIERRRVQEVDLAVFDDLEAGDVLFIDSAHVTKAGSDVNRLFFDVLPRLVPGVVVHVHDVLRGFEYPPIWVIDQNRSWNEAYLVRAFLQYNDSWEILLWDSALVEAGVELERRFPPMQAETTGSIWLRRTR